MGEGWLISLQLLGMSTAISNAELQLGEETTQPMGGSI